MHYVGMVLRYCISTNVVYMPGHVVDRGCDRPVESFVVQPSCIELVECGHDGGADLVSNPP